MRFRASDVHVKPIPMRTEKVAKPGHLIQGAQFFGWDWLVPEQIAGKTVYAPVWFYGEQYQLDNLRAEEACEKVLDLVQQYLTSLDG
jgi:hypothetical protein